MSQTSQLNNIVDAVLAYRPSKKSAKTDSNRSSESPLSYYEFFAGGGMVRAGLGPRWKCLMANDFDLKKGDVYLANWGHGELKTDSVDRLTVDDLPGCPSLVWASFPCQDLSLAGMGAGLRGDRSGTFWPFWRLVEKMKTEEGRGPRVVVLENVCGTLTSHDGKDFSSIVDALSDANYRLGALVINASSFVPQSRPRLFIIAVDENEKVSSELLLDKPSSRFHTKALIAAYKRLSPTARKSWVWWNVPPPRKRRSIFADLIEEHPPCVKWHSELETKQLLAMMSPLNLRKVKEAQKAGERLVGTIYKRTRRDENGRKVQRAEVRFDGVAGCLRTPAGGSSRQLVIVVDGRRVRSRLISSRETARLMGLPDKYKLPRRYNEAYHLTGDGVVVPVVRHLAKCIFEPLLLEKK